MTVPALESIIDDLSVIDDWEDRYRYIIDLGYALDPLPEDAHTEENKVRGCASQVWLETHVTRESGQPVLSFEGDSDAHIVRGLIALIFAFYSNQTASDILDRDAVALFKQLGLDSHLTPQRSNGVRAMVERIRNDAKKTLETA